MIPAKNAGNTSAVPALQSLLLRGSRFHLLFLGLCRTQFGKTILFTGNDGWTGEQTVSAYRSQYHIEDAFKQMKNPHFLGCGPMFHWADSKIQVHAFYCELARKGESISINGMSEELGAIWETLIV